MRQTLTGMVAAIGLMTAGAAPAMACGYGGCCTGLFASPCAPTYAPAYTYSGCGTCGGWGHGGWGFEHLAEPTTQYYPSYPTSQYYYVNQGPTFTGPDAFAPYPAYEEGMAPYYQGAGVEGPAVYGRPWHHYHPRHYGYQYGYAPQNYGYHYGPSYYGRRVQRRYY